MPCNAPRSDSQTYCEDYYISDLHRIEECTACRRLYQEYLERVYGNLQW